MNSKGQSLGLSVVIAITFFMIGVILINFFQPDITLVRTASGLDCENPAGISDATKLTCLTVDLVVPYFILTILSTFIGMITARFIGG